MLSDTKFKSTRPGTPFSTAEQADWRSRLVKFLDTSRMCTIEGRVPLPHIRVRLPNHRPYALIGRVPKPDIGVHGEENDEVWRKRASNPLEYLKQEAHGSGINQGDAAAARA